ncbi:hypothetical protein protein (plasmid) [Bacillus cereus G9241]|nr:hypothetical protein protein [Bacillus cereus G9241]
MSVKERLFNNYSTEIRRGFQTNRKSVDIQAEGKLLENISENDRIMKESADT